MLGTGLNLELVLNLVKLYVESSQKAEHMLLIDHLLNLSCIIRASILEILIIIQLLPQATKFCIVLCHYHLPYFVS